MAEKLWKISTISKIHYGKLFLRSALFIAALTAYIVSHLNGSGSMFGGYDSMWLWITVLAIYAVEMVLRCFPSDYESMGCQKQFGKNYIPSQSVDRKALLKQSARNTAPVLTFWVLLNSIFIALYIKGVFNWGIMILLSILYSVCDMICILFFCPFQTWMMKNKCCNTCRIYNWDYAMMFTPLIVVDNPYAKCLVALSLLLFIRWEISYLMHPERFYEVTNKSLACINCKEKLCHHKKQLRSFHRKIFTQLHQFGGELPNVASITNITQPQPKAQRH